jgi:hypothetical protein
MCCRLRLDLRELRKKSGGFFGSGESTGSVGVVTINMPRLAYEASDEKDSLERILDFTAGSRTDYREFLQKFAIVREETAIDLDSFDYGFYNYGMEVYGNMPLIEENEYREARKVEDLVIAIDTSASCQEVLVQKFLRETATLLHSQENFFHKVNIHIIECDDQVQNDVLITGMDDMEKYTEGFSVKGGYGTDFRPVFRYVEQLQKSGELVRTQFTKLVRIGR